MKDRIKDKYKTKESKIKDNSKVVFIFLYLNHYKKNYTFTIYKIQILYLFNFFKNFSKLFYIN